MTYYCAECGKQLRNLKCCWWRRFYRDIEVFCPKCALRHTCSIRGDFGLISCDVIPPPPIS